ncbi:MAG: hypothetical protein GTN86_06580 [Xanthomonadales bacterium]|nr:hypothetical protein [Xanthomonadales bacterium]NIN60555.1 hypothetical protein [Xanthomonadales bacterium]NIN75907.1 hypothetical protein [Xanthomonadales bacterium]NIO14999.1 hypothetical protein [Xanthomonadales bacterium]NIP12948.1 hypothetical protein [Xanthomonadales bacterium]
MTFKNLFIEHSRSDEEEAWLQEEIEEQEARFLAIEQAMEDLTPRRARWYQEFFDRITTIGFNVDGDDKRVIPRAGLPVQPEGRRDRVVWKYGADSED